MFLFLPMLFCCCICSAWNMYSFSVKKNILFLPDNRLLTTLNLALQNSGIDLSQASISVQINLGKRAIKRSAPGSNSTSKVRCSSHTINLTFPVFCLSVRTLLQFVLLFLVKFLWRNPFAPQDLINQASRDQEIGHQLRSGDAAREHSQATKRHKSDRWQLIPAHCRSPHDLIHILRSPHRGASMFRVYTTLASRDG